MAVPDGIDPATRYNTVARTLHAVIAVLVITNATLGLLHDALEKIFNVMALHKSIGLTVLGLTVLRILWRFTWTTPPYNPPIARWERVTAKTVHTIFYVLLLAIPLTGFTMASASPRGVQWFGIPVPTFDVERDTPVWEAAHEGHEIMAFMAIALIALHVGAALRHHFVLKDGVLRRMW